MVNIFFHTKVKSSRGRKALFVLVAAIVKFISGQSAVPPLKEVISDQHCFLVTATKVKDKTNHK